MNTKALAISAVSLAQAYVLSYIKFKLPFFAASVTACSMFFITFTGYIFGLRIGLLVAFAYSMLQFLQGPYILSLFQVGCDYLLAFTCLGLSGCFQKKKHGLVIGYLVAVFGRGVFHVLGGYLYWMDYMPETFPKALAFGYPVIANFVPILIEAAVTVLLISLSPVKKSLERVKKYLLE